MSDSQTSPSRGSRCLELFGLGLMSIAAFWVAACVHSIGVWHRGYRFYNAELGGSYFYYLTYDHSQAGYFGSILTFLGACGVLGLPLTFLILLPFRRRVLYRWVMWVCCTALLTYLRFKTEVAIG
jgi:hypothetical protein